MSESRHHLSRASLANARLVTFSLALYPPITYVYVYSMFIISYSALLVLSILKMRSGKCMVRWVGKVFLHAHFEHYNCIGVLGVGDTKRHKQVDGTERLHT